MIRRKICRGVTVCDGCDGILYLEENHTLQSDNEVLGQEKVKLQSDNQKLADQKMQIQRDIDALADSKKKLDRNTHLLDEDARWQLPEVSIMQSAKAYREKSAFPLVQKLKEHMKTLMVENANLVSQAKRMAERLKRLDGDVTWYKKKIRQQTEKIDSLQEQAADLERVKRYAGEDKVREMVGHIKEIEQFEREQRRLQRNRRRSMER